MAEENKPTPTSIMLSEPHVVELDDSYYDEENDPEIIDPQQPSHEGYREGNHIFRFSRLDDLVQSHTAACAAAIRRTRPYNDCHSRELHNERQRAIWQQIRTQAEADENIPRALFSPPRTYIEVRVSEWPISSHYCCPCDIAETNCEVIEIRAPKDSGDGITKDIFIQQVSDAMYGRAADAGENNEGIKYWIGGEDDRPVIEQFDYMIQGGNSGEVHIMGHIFALTKGISPKAQYEKAS
ncbi:hypothetical protein F5Y00DRAFT_122765 [Daldinia vernicosa]|uniref:uncharacterized protein n=1 Tax=Daldinia vernicosa TaxID=114800 RepID=UPI0020088547|nr:uncharacterized protein F5Y00DRAFT_122765 [Daldinia vernicosa]KAI0847198.1 hypothetical protein F5Y00DRAFT_122765 [Daldinia vernicosa]